MQKSVYTCDHCKRLIGQKMHVSLHTHNNSLSGIAVPPKDVAGDDILGNNFGNVWKVTPLPATFMHFHLECVGEYFEKWARFIEKFDKIPLPNFEKPERLFKDLRRKR